MSTKKKERAYDWIIHYVFSEEEDIEYSSDIHTHGISKYNHPELMLCLSIPQELACGILNYVGEEIRNGKRFDREEIRCDILANEMPVKLVRREFGEEERMVIILPDENGKFPEDNGCKEPYNKQLEMIDEFQKQYKEK